MDRITTTECARSIGAVVHRSQGSVVQLTRRGDVVAVVVGWHQARKAGILCEHDDDPKSCTACKVLNEPYGDGEFDDAAADLAFDAARERGFRAPPRD